ncbi:MAG TPA: hypothetical protein VFA26_08215, partial [Gemmataceae bacterium]|nr:hypothetical protein [Gemmataceae bacterium]
APAVAADLDRAPINYATAPADNPVSRLQQRIDKGQVKLAHDDKFGYLPALLKQLSVSPASQTLVFSKTSFQRDRIGPRTPRALYFSDDVYIGYCQHGTVLEVTAVDPQLGAVFYSLEQEQADKPRFIRQGDSCLICHGSSQNHGYPGHLIRSVYPDPAGLPMLASGSYRIDHTSPLEQRWGGWYVTGTSGKQKHLGNLIVRGRQRPEAVDNTAGVNVTSLKGRCDTSGYLTPHSDIVALMVLEHQAQAHNLITRAGMETRIALYQAAEMNKALGRPADYRSDGTTHRIEAAAEPLVRYLLFCEEAKLTDTIRGTSGFAEEFVKRGPRDPRGRSLRDLDLKRRLFTYPCSYLICSAAFDALPDPVKDRVLQRLYDVLSGKDTSADFAHLTAADRRAVLEILLATKPNLPKYWKLPSSSPSR